MQNNVNECITICLFISQICQRLQRWRISSQMEGTAQVNQEEHLAADSVPDIPSISFFLQEIHEFSAASRRFLEASKKLMTNPQLKSLFQTKMDSSNETQQQQEMESDFEYEVPKLERHNAMSYPPVEEEKTDNLKFDKEKLGQFVSEIGFSEMLQELDEDPEEISEVTLVYNDHEVIILTLNKRTDLFSICRYLQ